jgi:hypothetical protein
MQRYFREVVKRVREFPPFQINERRVYQFHGLFERWVARSGRREIRVLFYPDLPHPKSAVSKICYLNGYDTTNDSSQKYDLAIHWRDETRRETDSVLDAIANQTRVINYECRDISKKRVDSDFREIFGYSVMIDPLTHRGPCVVKSDQNALHDGKIMMCPLKGVRRDFVYQKVINNAVGEKTVQDIRVPVFRNRIPFVYLKDRPAEERIRFRKFNKATMVPVSSIISGDEKEKILAFTEKFGLDYGEVDVLRDNDDGRLYIIDVNNTPFGPPKHLHPDLSWQALKIMGRYFGEVFMNGK